MPLDADIQYIIDIFPFYEENFTQSVSNLNNNLDQ